MLYKFLRLKDGAIKSQSGEQTWTIGEWYEETRRLNLCRVGFHASEKPLDALSYVNGEVLAIVGTAGDHRDESDKQCWQKMRIVRAYRWTKTDSVALAIFSAELVIEIFEKKFPNDGRPRKAIEAAKAYLKDPGAYAAYAACAAANAANAANAAAHAANAAYAAAYAARAAARAAADAARAAYAARAATLNAINQWIIDRIPMLEVMS